MKQLRVLALVSALCGLILESTQIARAQVARDCTLYAAADGRDTNSGKSPSAPKTLNGASAVSQPGSTICLKGGTYNISSTFYPARGGTEKAWIVYKAYGDSPAEIVWTGGGSSTDLIGFFGRLPWTGQNYIEMRDLTLNGQNSAAYGFKCNNTHHLRFVGNQINNMSAGGIGSVLCDYLTADSNMVFLNGYNQGWSSGISFNSNQWYGGYLGFHNLVLNNVIAGTFDASSYKTDGNGIIMDLSNRTYDARSANTPPALIANNVVYQNGGRCINTFVVTHIWVVNNTCYSNALDMAQTDGEIVTNKSRDSYFLNNIAYSWNNRQPFMQLNTNQNITYYRNIVYGGALGFRSPFSSEFIVADPLLVGPPVLHPTRDGQYRTAVEPARLGDGLALRAASPAIDRGLDPTTIPGVSVEIAAGLRQFVFTDREGTPRPQGAGFDIGAYEYLAPAPAQVRR
ncbi:MAG: choice-of-anchor Q domain-containing protein [Vicinamibacterales bacterium]